MTLQSIDKVPKLYLLTNDDELTTLLDKLERVFDTGAVSLLQVRRKSTLKLYDLATVYREAEMIVSLANDYDIKVVMNDSLELASHFGTGLHLGQRDGSCTGQRDFGRPCGDWSPVIQTLLYLKKLSEKGQLTVLWGTAFASITKPRAKIISKDILKSLRT